MASCRSGAAAGLRELARPATRVEAAARLRSDRQPQRPAGADDAHARGQGAGGRGQGRRGPGALSAALKLQPSNPTIHNLIGARPSCSATARLKALEAFNQALHARPDVHGRPQQPGRDVRRARPVRPRRGRLPRGAGRQPIRQPRRRLLQPRRALPRRAATWPRPRRTCAGGQRRPGRSRRSSCSAQVQQRLEKTGPRREHLARGVGPGARAGGRRAVPGRRTSSEGRTDEARSCTAGSIELAPQSPEAADARTRAGELTCRSSTS